MATLSYQLVIAWGAFAITGAAEQPASDWQPRVRTLIRQLGDPSFAKREAAAKALLAEGDKIVPLLDQARKNADLELGRRVDRIRFQLVGFIEELTAHLSGPAFRDGELPVRSRIDRLLFPKPDPLPGILEFVASHQPKSGDFLLKIIGDPNHRLHRPATQLFCESCSTGSSQQLKSYLQTTFHLHSAHRQRYPQGVDAYIETHFSHPYGSIGWPKNLRWQVRMNYVLDGKQYGKPFVYTYPGAGAASGWINAGKLEQGDHTVRCTVEYALTHHDVTHECKSRSAEFVFAVGPAILANDLIAPMDAALLKRVRAALRMLDYTGQDGPNKVARPWHPQITWDEPKDARRGLHVPVWAVTETLPVDLCFEVTIRDLQTGKRYPAEPVVIHKGKVGHGAFTPRDARAFCADRDGFIEVQIDLQPSRAQALTDPAVTSYFGWPILSPTLRAKIIGETKRMESK